MARPRLTKKSMMSLSIRRPKSMTPAQRILAAQWLRNQATNLLQNGDQMVAGFRAMFDIVNGPDDH